MRNRYFAWMAALVMILLALAGTACAEEWTCPVCGQTGNTGKVGGKCQDVGQVHGQRIVLRCPDLPGCARTDR